MFREILKLLVTFVYRILIICSVCTWAVEGKLTLDGKIVGGEYAKISNFPHAVFLSMTCGEVNMICGSSIINQVILVTAAHCLQCKNIFSINAQAGDDNLKQVSVVRKAIKIKTHPNYSDTTLSNDIALILLAQNLPLGNNIKRVIIKKGFPEKATAYVAGWGITDDLTRSRTFYLKMVQVALPPQKECSVVGYINPGMLCAGTTRSTKHRPSRGDSGSALITTDYQQLGIVSFRTEPNIAMLVYTNISYYYSWIQNTAKLLYCSPRN